MKQIFSFFLSLLSCSFVLAQDSALLIKKADSLYRKKNYHESVLCYKSAFQKTKPAGNDLYNAACSAALDSNISLAFEYLKASIENGWKNYRHILRDSDLNILHNRPQWESTLLPLKMETEKNLSRIRKNSIRILNPEKLGDSIYNALKPFPLIMLGEIHGQNESAKYFTSLVNMFADKGDSVLVGMEISAEKMKEFLSHPCDSNILKSEFFSQKALYGIESQAWAGAIKTLYKRKKVHVFFFDQTTEQVMVSGNRDSLMYINIKNQMKAHPGWRTLTLTGNIHNMLLPYRNDRKTAWFLHYDPELKLKDKICSLDFRYRSGSMINNTGKGLQQRSSDNESDYSEAFSFDHYLCMFEPDPSNTYSGVMFCRYITAAEMVNK